MLFRSLALALAFLLALSSAVLADVQIKSGASTDTLTIDPTLKAGRTATYPRETSSATAGGIYTVRFTTGVLAAALAVNAAVVCFREAAAPTRNIYLLRIQGAFSWVVAATAAQQFGFYMERMSAANCTGGATNTPLRYSTSNGASEAQEIRVATTAALGVAGVTFEGFQVPILSWTNSAIGSGVNDMPTLFDSSEGGPIRLAAGEGLAIRNLIVWPAAGTGVLSLRFTWEER